MEGVQKRTKLRNASELQDHTHPPTFYLPLLSLHSERTQDQHFIDFCSPSMSVSKVFCLVYVPKKPPMKLPLLRCLCPVPVPAVRAAGANWSSEDGEERTGQLRKIESGRRDFLLDEQLKVETRGSGSCLLDGLVGRQRRKALMRGTRASIHEKNQAVYLRVPVCAHLFCCVPVNRDPASSPSPAPPVPPQEDY